MLSIAKSEVGAKVTAEAAEAAEAAVEAAVEAAEEAAEEAAAEVEESLLQFYSLLLMGLPGFKHLGRRTAR